MGCVDVESDEQFEQLLEEASEKNFLTVVDFYTSWCGPCKILKPILEQIALDMKDKPVQFLKVNCEDLDQLSESYNITSIPTLVYVIDRLVVHETRGSVSKEDLTNTVEQYIESLTPLHEKT